MSGLKIEFNSPIEVIPMWVPLRKGQEETDKAKITTIALIFEDAAIGMMSDFDDRPAVLVTMPTEFKDQFIEQLNQALN